jgi:hypothetical protein
MATIETVYRVRVDYDCDEWDKPVDTILKFGRSLDECNIMTGNAACYPYAVGESDSKKKVEAWAGKVERYIKRLKGGRLNP